MRKDFIFVIFVAILGLAGVYYTNANKKAVNATSTLKKSRAIIQKNNLSNDQSAKANPGIRAGEEAKGIAGLLNSGIRQTNNISDLSRLVQNENGTKKGTNSQIEDLEASDQETFEEWQAEFAKWSTLFNVAITDSQKKYSVYSGSECKIQFDEHFGDGRNVLLRKGTVIRVSDTRLMIIEHNGSVTISISDLTTSTELDLASKALLALCN